MKKIAGSLMVLAGVCGACAYWVDLVNFTDLSKGFVAVGSVWVRYGILMGLLAAGLLASRMASRRPAALEQACVPLGLAAWLCAAVFAGLGALQLAVWYLSGGSLSVQAADQASSLLTFALGVLALFCAWWLGAAGRLWLSGAPRAPRGMAVGILGSLYFLLLTCARFATNASSLYRFAQTTETFSALAALVLVSLLVRVCFFPESGCGRKLFWAGIWAFYLCTCCEVPQAAVRWMAGQTQMGDLLTSLTLGFVGLLGAVLALASLSGEVPADSES